MPSACVRLIPSALCALEMSIESRSKSEQKLSSFLSPEHWVVESSVGDVENAYK